MNTKVVVLLVMVGAGVAAASAYLGYRIGAAEVADCFECCPEGFLCWPEEEWLVKSIDEVTDEAECAEIDKMLDQCWKEQEAARKNPPVDWDKKIIDLTKAGNECRLNLAECQGALTECQRK